MKRCSICKIEKPKTEYYKRLEGKEGLNARCKDCTRVANKASGQVYYQNNAERLHAYSKEKYNKATQNATNVIGWVRSQYTGVPCMDCRGIFDFVAMDFDHRPEEIKEFGIGGMGNHKATPERLVKVMKEISKCDLVCSNCHRVRTHKTRKQDA